MYSEIEIYNLVITLIKEKNLSKTDIADVIAEQVSIAKDSDVPEIKSIAEKLEKKFGSKYQQSDITLNYNKKADDFGSYFMTLLQEISSSNGRKAIAICLSALELAFLYSKKEEKDNFVETEFSNNFPDNLNIGKVIITSPYNPPKPEVQSIEGIKNYLYQISKLSRYDLYTELSNVLAAKHNLLIIGNPITEQAKVQAKVTDLTDKVVLICIHEFGRDTVMNYANGNIRKFNQLVNNIDEEIAQEDLAPIQHGMRVLQKLSQVLT
jgi:hypothetical protein